jgi:hypothetical protein
MNIKPKKCNVESITQHIQSRAKKYGRKKWREEGKK